MSESTMSDALKRAIEGDPSVEVVHDPDDIRIDVSSAQEPEVNPVIYKDVENLIFRGFLTVSSEINGVSFIFKSMNHHEFEHIQWLNGTSTTTEGIHRFYNTFMAYGIFMVDGQNILPEREKWVSTFQKAFGEFPAPARAKIIRALSEVNRKASNAVTLAEGYVLENTSRFRWAQLMGMDLMRTSCTGVLGTEALGFNYAQLVWRALNHYEDLREVAEREWDYAKFIGSCFAGKEIKKLFDQDKERRQKERDARLERRDKLIRQVVLGETSEEEEARKGPVKTVAKTVEELAKQLESDLRGEKDWHDLIVEAEQKRIAEQVSQRRQRSVEMSKVREEEMNGAERSAYTNMTGLSPQEVQQRLVRRRQLEAQKAAQSMVNPGMMDQRMSDFLEKHSLGGEGTYEPDKGIDQTDRDPTTVMPTPTTPRNRPPPFRRGT